MTSWEPRGDMIFHQPLQAQFSLPPPALQPDLPPSPVPFTCPGPRSGRAARGWRQQPCRMWPPRSWDMFKGEYKKRTQDLLMTVSGRVLRWNAKPRAERKISPVTTKRFGLIQCLGNWYPKTPLLVGQESSTLPQTVGPLMVPLRPTLGVEGRKPTRKGYSPSLPSPPQAT